MKTTFKGFEGKDFSSAYNNCLTDVQGKAVEGFGGVCGINETCSIVNQQTGSKLTEADGVNAYRST